MIGHGAQSFSEAGDCKGSQNAKAFTPETSCWIRWRRIWYPQHVTGSGNGTLDLRLFTFSGSEIQNSSGSFNGDNGDNTLPQGGGADTTAVPIAGLGPAFWIGGVGFGERVGAAKVRNDLR